MVRAESIVQPDQEYQGVRVSGALRNRIKIATDRRAWDPGTQESLEQEPSLSSAHMRK